jgi:hypothetical protein
MLFLSFDRLKAANLDKNMLKYGAFLLLAAEAVTAFSPSAAPRAQLPALRMTCDAEGVASRRDFLRLSTLAGM